MQEKDKKLKTPKYVMPRSFSVEISRKGRGIAVTVSGVISIIELQDQKCVFKVRGANISIKGENLSVSIFENSTCEITGAVKGIELI
jgi:hypothetical protein